MRGCDDDDDDDDETGVKQTRRVLARFSWITSSLLLTMYGWFSWLTRESLGIGGCFVSLQMTTERKKSREIVS